VSSVCLFRTRRAPTSPLFPYTTLFRSEELVAQVDGLGGVPLLRRDVLEPVALVVGGVVDEHRDRADLGCGRPQGGDVREVALGRSEEHTSELQSRGHLVCRLLLEKNNT